MKVREQKDGRLIANFQGTSRLIFGQEEAMGLRLQLDGKTVVLPNIFDPRLALYEVRSSRQQEYYTFFCCHIFFSVARDGELADWGDVLYGARCVVR